MKIGSLFSGIGGLELGLEMAELGETVWQVEMDPYCTRVLEKHWPKAMRFNDVRNVYGDEMGRLKKLTEKQVDDAVVLYDGGCSLGDLSKVFGVSRQSMWDLLRRRTEMRPQARYGEDNNFFRGGAKASDLAQGRLEKAVTQGKMSRPTACEECAVEERKMRDGRSNIQAHHDDYNKPLDVRWLCQPCHHEWHKHNTAIERKEESEEVVAGPVDLICGGFP